ncbi:MAG: RNA polymerase sigma factor [Candidatus Hydrogenedentes bacterium]|nr:RNA polymerase sigma factor [Candidatus Hydrogenedentota bacterium]
MTASDQALLDRWYVHRDAEAFKTIAQRHAGMVYATCRRVLRNPSDAEEVAQECFEVLCSTHRRPNKNLASWLHTVATNRAINRIRSDKRRAEKVSAYALESRPNAEIEWNDLYDLVDEAIAELPPDLSEPVVRHFFEDESHDDIARSLGLTRSAVTHRIHRAVDRLRSALQRRGIEIAAGALSVLLAKNAAAEIIPHTLTVSIAKLALAGPAVTSSAAGATIVAAKIVFACLLTAVAGFVVWKGLERKEPASGTPSVTAFATTQHESPDSSRDAAQTPSQPSGSSDFARAMTQALADSGANPSATTAITGRVYIVETGEPVSGMEIVLEPLGDRPEPQATVRTNGDGTYRMTVPVPGEYHIRRSYSHPGLPSPENDPRTIRIAEGQVVEDLDFPIVMGIRVSGICVDEQGNPVSGAQVEGRDRDNYRSLESYITREDGRFALAGFPKTPRFTIDAEVRGKLVSDLYGPTPLKGDVKDVRVIMRPVASIAGTVVDASGRPLPGIRVSANPMEQELQRYVGSSAEETADNGTFHLAGLAPGNHRLFLQVPNASILRKPATGPEFIELTAGKPVNGLRLVYENPDSVGLTIAGRVVDAKGTPVANAEVRSHGADAYRIVQSNDAGEFLIGGLPDTTVTLVAEHAEHAKAMTENVAAGTTGLELVMDDLGTLEGQVVDAVTGKPVEQFELVHLDMTTRSHVGERTRMRPQIDPEGQFRIEKVAPGPVLLVAKADGYAETELEVEDLAPGQTISNLRIALSGGTTLEVSVRDAAGEPVAGAYLIPGGVPNGMEPRLAAAAQTDAEGRFTLNNQPSTLDLLSVYHESYALANTPLSLKAGSDNDVSVTLSTGCVLEGGVFVDGEPAEAVEVRLFFGNAPGVQRYTTKTDAAGAYRFEHLPTGGAHALTLMPILLDDDARITRWFSQSVSLQGGKSAPLDFNLPPVTAAVEGFVTHDNAPAPASNMTLLVTTPFGTEQRNANVDSTGAYRFDAVPAGHATLRADIYAQGLSSITEFELTDGQTAQVDLALVAVK